MSAPIVRAILKQSQLSEHGGTYGIDDALQQSNELEHGGILFMARHTYINIAGDAV